VNEFKAAMFTATKVENKDIKDTYDVTITITGILDVGSGQNQSISAEVGNFINYTTDQC
jgi:hypothetical protein